MSKIFKPRRGSVTTMTSTDKKSTVLAKGEMFIEVPNNGVGTGPSRLIMGNGTDTYETISNNHKYAIDGVSGYNTSEVEASSTATTVSGILNDVTSGKTIRNLFGNLKKAINKNASDISNTIEEYEHDISTINSALNGLRFGTDSSGKYGYYKVGADTVTPFRNPQGDAVAGDVLIGKTFANASSDDVVGTMYNWEAWTAGVGTPSGNNQTTVAIPAGYHNGNGYVTCKGQTSYAQGVTDADNRANPNSENWKNGRSQGHADRKTTMLTLTVNPRQNAAIVTNGNGADLISLPISGSEEISLSVNCYVGFNNGITTN